MKCRMTLPAAVTGRKSAKLRALLLVQTTRIRKDTASPLNPAEFKQAVKLVSTNDRAVGR